MATILIVEDDPILRLSAQTMVEDWGHTALTASDVDEALAIIRSPAEIDVLFTDIYLKTESLGGCNLAKEAIKLRPRLRVLYVTGYTLTSKVRGMFVSGAGCLGKPYSDKSFKDAIESLMATA